MSSFEDLARSEIELQEGFRQWIADRIEVIHQTTTAAEVLRRNGVRLRYDGQRPEQMFCPFHGNSKSMAARFHPSDARRSDHVWCFVCNEQWDCITLFKKFASYEGKFSGLLRLMERDYGIIPPEIPEISFGKEVAREELDQVAQMLGVCERRLFGARGAFAMRGFLALGSILDRVTYGINAGTVSLPKARETLQTVLTKIGEKGSACLGD